MAGPPGTRLERPTEKWADGVFVRNGRGNVTQMSPLGGAGRVFSLVKSDFDCGGDGHVLSTLSGGL